MESAQTRQGGQGAQADNDSILKFVPWQRIWKLKNVLSDISWGSNDNTTILTDQTFILVKIQTQEEAQKNLHLDNYKNENAIFNNNASNDWKYIPLYKATQTAAVPVILC